MKILVIGGTGTMGAPLVELLYPRNEVHVVCRKKREENQCLFYHYGDAKDESFISSLFNRHRFDSIIDFCWYTSEEFQIRHQKLLNATNQYICLSSSAVVADGDIPFTESSPRYIEIAPPSAANNKEYHYEKARIEDILIKSKFQNWTIIRPHITYNDNHFGWGEYGEEDFLIRSMIGNVVIIPKDMLPRLSSMTYGGDVAKMIALLVGNNKAFGQIINVCSPQAMNWGEILDVYKRIFHKYNIKLRCCYFKDSRSLQKAIPQLRYRYITDRLLNRVFSIDKFEGITGEKFHFVNFEEQLDRCVGRYIATLGCHVTIKSAYSFAKYDKITKEWTPLKYFVSKRDKLTYIIFRIPGLSFPYRVIIRFKRFIKTKYNA